MKITKDMKVGDIYLNPCMQDLWILRKRYTVKDKSEWVLVLIHDDYEVDYEEVKDFIKLGNIYEIFGRIDELLS